MSIKILEAAREHLSAIDPGEDPTGEVAEVIDLAVARMARVDGDRVLDTFEAEAIKHAYEDVVPDGGPLIGQRAEDFMSAVAVRCDALCAARPSSNQVYFTSEGNALTTFREQIVGNMRSTIEKAQGKPVDINIMIFSFTDPEIADGILEIARNTEDYPNVTIRLLGDWTGLSNGEHVQTRRLADIARQEGLTRLIVKFKKDNPYVWDEERGRPRYNHGATDGLNHHKGYVSLIEGRPEKMAMGSFNWSVGAMRRNYENLQVLDRADPANRPLMDSYQEEFEAFWNNSDVALTREEALTYREDIFEAMHAERGLPYERREIDDPGIEDPIYDATDTSGKLDINSFCDIDVETLEEIVGSTLVQRIQKELVEWGRFDTWNELLTRVPEVADLDDEDLEDLRAKLEYGDGGLSINTANATELDRAGFTGSQAERIVAFRGRYGFFESVDELQDIRGIGEGTLQRVGDNLTDDHHLATYSGRVPGEQPRYGYATTHPRHISVVAEGPDQPYAPGSDDPIVPPWRENREETDANMAVLVKSLLRRAQPGQTFRTALYGVSTGSPEYRELKAAAERGVRIRAVLYRSYNGPAMDGLEELQAQGHDVDFRVISTRVMHEKFGVVGDDVFNGSANWSTSSIRKHSEDRFLFRNRPKIAARFVEEFERLWDRAS